MLTCFCSAAKDKKTGECLKQCDKEKDPAKKKACAQKCFEKKKKGGCKKKCEKEKDAQKKQECLGKCKDKKKKKGSKDKKKKGKGLLICSAAILLCFVCGCFVSLNFR